MITTFSPWIFWVALFAACAVTAEMHLFMLIAGVWG
jgi:hypothetical protein